MQISRKGPQSSIQCAYIDRCTGSKAGEYALEDQRRNSPIVRRQTRKDRYITSQSSASTKAHQVTEDVLENVRVCVEALLLS